MKTHLGIQETAALHRRIQEAKASGETLARVLRQRPESLPPNPGDSFRCARCRRVVTRLDGEPGIHNLCGNCWGKD